MIASLPMYDWPEHRGVTDRLWRLIASALRDRGISVPDRLDRESDLNATWLRPDLLVSQTCGLPYVRRLGKRVRLVGAVDHGIGDLPGGLYCSRIIVRTDDPARTLADLRARRAAFNAGDSQSGAGALRHMVLPLVRNAGFFGETLATGGHVASIRAVAEGRADTAAIDAATWELALRHLPETAGLRVLLSTPPTPGLPLITACDGPAEALFAATNAALTAMSLAERQTLLFHRLLPRTPSDFDIVAQWDAEAGVAGYRELHQGSA